MNEAKKKAEPEVDEEADEPKVREVKTEAAESASDEEDYHWYVLQVRGGKEEKIRKKIMQKFATEGLREHVEELLVPKEKISEIKGGERTVREKKLFPGYLMLRGEMTEELEHVARSIRGAWHFLGDEEPKALSDQEVNEMLAPTADEEEQPKVKIDFEEGDSVRIKEGPFENMEGVVEELIPEKGLVRVTVTIFGRATPVELEYWQLEEI